METTNRDLKELCTNATQQFDRSLVQQREFINKQFHDVNRKLIKEKNTVKEIKNDLADAREVISSLEEKQRICECEFKSAIHECNGAITAANQLQSNLPNKRRNTNNKRENTAVVHVQNSNPMTHAKDQPLKENATDPLYMPSTPEYNEPGKQQPQNQQTKSKWQTGRSQPKTKPDQATAFYEEKPILSHQETTEANTKVEACSSNLRTLEIYT